MIKLITSYDAVDQHKIIFTEYDNVFMAMNIQLCTFGLVAIALVIVSRYTIFNSGRVVKSKKSRETEQDQNEISDSEK